MNRSDWELFVAGGVPACACGGRLALAAAQARDTYRFICVPCGRATRWFVVVGGVPMDVTEHDHRAWFGAWS